MKRRSFVGLLAGGFSAATAEMGGSVLQSRVGAIIHK
jgi:hypothetical protein